MGNIVKIRNVNLGSGIPKICIPFTDTSLESLEESIHLLGTSPYDLIEWRADFYRNANEPGDYMNALTIFRKALGNTPILFTVRTRAEGGMIDISTEKYAAILLAIVKSGLIDMVDVEISRGEEIVRTLVNAAHEYGVKVVGSHHNFIATPNKHTIVDTLCQMQAMGCDIVKFAAMPQCPRDVLTLLDATLTMQEEHSATPVITMSMGRTGMISRICGQVFGSCVTFGTVGKASAPGQLPATQLASILNRLS